MSDRSIFVVRELALNCALKMSGTSCAEELIKQAAIIESYLLNDIPSKNGSASPLTLPGFRESDIAVGQ